MLTVLERYSLRSEYYDLNEFGASGSACDPAHPNAESHARLHWTEGQLLIDFFTSRAYQLANRTRHASQRCAPGGSFLPKIRMAGGPIDAA